MGIWDTIDWSNLIQNVGIISSLLFTAYTVFEDNQVRKISNLNSIVDRHRELWENYLGHPHLSRVLEKGADLNQQPLSNDEEIFVSLVIVHLDSVHRAK